MMVETAELPESANRRAVADWAETMGMETLRNHLASMDGLKSDSITTLTVMIAAASATLGYVMSNASEGHITPITYGSAFLSLCLFGIAGLLVLKCLRVEDAPTVGNHPLRLYQPHFSLAELKAKELENIEGRIAMAIARNTCTAKWLNRARVMALVSPVLAAAVSGTVAIAVRCL